MASCYIASQDVICRKKSLTGATFIRFPDKNSFFIETFQWLSKSSWHYVYSQNTTIYFLYGTIHLERHYSAFLRGKREGSRDFRCLKFMITPRAKNPQRIIVNSFSLIFQLAKCRCPLLQTRGRGFFSKIVKICGCPKWMVLMLIYDHKFKYF